jgi:hypothetical protein
MIGSIVASDYFSRPAIRAAACFRAASLLPERTLGSMHRPFIAVILCADPIYVPAAAYIRKPTS